jgi:hypothetical protein
VRPAGLLDTVEPTDDYEVAPRRLPGRYTSRADLADTLIGEATEPQHSRSIVEVITRSGPPSPLTTFLKEAFGEESAVGREPGRAGGHRLVSDEGTGSGALQRSDRVSAGARMGIPMR